MTHSKQAAKRVRQSERRRVHNRAVRSFIKSNVKAVKGAATQADAVRLMPNAVKALDKAAKRRIIHPNAAARLKSRLAKAAKAKAKA